MGGAQGSSSAYRLSFTAGGLFLDSAPAVAAVYLRHVAAAHNQGEPGNPHASRPEGVPPGADPTPIWAGVRAEIQRDNLLQTRTVSSSQRLSQELVRRLATLSEPELHLLVDATATERGHLLWVAACRQYEFVADFAQEVVRERFLLMRPTLTAIDVDDFIARKAVWHPELDQLKPTTLRKVQTTLFQMMRQAGLMADDGDLTNVMLSPRVAHVLAERAPSDLRFFPNVDGRRGDS